MGTQKQKTIFIAIINGFAARYLLQTDILAKLRKADVLVVILAPNALEMHFRRDYESENVIVEQLEVDKCREHARGSFLINYIKWLLPYVLSSKHDLKSVNEGWKIRKMGKKAGSLVDKVKFCCLRSVNDFLLFFLQRSHWLREKLRWLISQVYRGDFHQPLFNKYNPDLVVVTSLGYFSPEDYVILEAVRNGVKWSAVILSWDNTSSKGMGVAIPDCVIAWTDNMKRELEIYHDISAERVKVSGIAHFDIYHRTNGNSQLQSRKNFLRHFGLDPERKILLVATKTPTAYPWNPEVARILAEAEKSGRFVSPCQIVVRLHPNYFRLRNGELINAHLVDEFRMLEAEFKHLILNVPTIRSQILSADMPRSEMVESASLIKHANVLINFFSTMAIEASLCDVPIVNVVFNGKTPELRTHPRQDIAIDLQHVHNQRLLRKGGTRQAFNEAELLEYINSYLQDATLDAAGRERICASEGGPFPGYSGQKAGELLLEIIGTVDG